jgi:hypothetical protein
MNDLFSNRLQHQCSPADVIGGLYPALGHPTSSLVFLNLSGGLVEPVGSVAQKNDTQDGHEISAGIELGIGAQIIGSFPEVSFKFYKVLH